MGSRDKGYKRSWKNLLLNKRYQLRFTFLMVGLSALLMLALGLWVLSEAEEATAVDEMATATPDCEISPPEVKPAGEKPPSIIPDAPAPKPVPAPDPPAPDPVKPEQPPGAGESGDKPGPDGIGDGAGANESSGADEKPAADGAGDKPGDKPAADGTGEKPAGDGASEAGEKPAGDGASEAGTGDGATGDGGDDDGAEPERPRRPIKVEISDIQLTQEAQEEQAKVQAMRLARCEHQKKKLAHINDGYKRIKLVLIAVGLFLVLGLSIFGIKMTHRVAGPLYKVTLYFNKLRKGVYDQVYSLRKGDQLVEFYEQFKAAHAGLRSMEEKDVEVLESLVAEADEAKLEEKSPEMKQAVEDIRALLKRKQESLK